MYGQEIKNKAYKNISLYKWYSTTLFTPFMLPVLVLFWHANKMDAMDIYLLQGIYAVAVVLLEVPTGMVADLLGKRKSLIMATTILFLSMLFYSFGNGFVDFLIAELGLALGSAFYSGADSALLYDSLVAVDKKDDYQRLEGRNISNQQISFAICNLIGGVVGSYSMRAALFISCLGPLFALLMVYKFSEINPNTAGKKVSLKQARLQYKKLLREATRFVFKHKLVRWNIMFFAVIAGSSTWLLWQYQPYMSYTGLPIWMFGIAFASFNFFSAYISRRASKLSNKLGRNKTLLLITGLHLIVPILMGLIITPISFILIWGHQFVRGIARPVISSWILEHTYEDKRATVLSLQALLVRFFFTVTSPLIGWISKVTPIGGAIMLQSLVSFCFLIPLYFLYKQIPIKYFTIKKRLS